MTYKILGQVAPSNTDNADLYTVPSAKSAVISTLLASNTSSSPASCRIYVRKNAETASKNNAIIYDGVIESNDFKAITIGITMADGDVLTVQSGTQNSMTFQAFGSEVG